MAAADYGQLIEWICLTDPNDVWAICHNATNHRWDWSTFDYRIAQPKIAPGHNPHNLTNEQVETHLGWRLLDTDEIKARKQTYKEIEVWYYNGMQWNTDKCQGNCRLNAYRTRLTREQLAALDNPPQHKKRLPLGPEDFPPGTILRWILDKTTWFAILAKNKNGVFVYRSGKIGFDQIMNDGERSLDGGKTWLPCYREE